MGKKAQNSALVDITNSLNPSKSKAKSKSTSKSKFTSKSKPSKKIESQNETESEPLLDRLRLARSDLSNLINQIDELVAQASKLKLMSKAGSQEIESFTHLLSDMHLSLKLWVPRFQKVFSTQSTQSDKQLEQTLAAKTVSTAKEVNDDKENSPTEPESISLVSPSPLVSWRAGCRVESGKQLFLLTPLPRSKILTSKHKNASKSAFEKFTGVNAPTCTFGLPPFFTASGKFHNDLLERVEVKPTPNKFCMSMATETGTTKLDCGFASPSKTSNWKNRDTSMYVTTPRLKISPLKTCVLLEPMSVSFEPENYEISKSPTSFGIGTQNCNVSGNSESSSSGVSESLASKYPELFGHQLTHKSGGRKEVETSLDWFLSPPKTCVLMEPPDVKLPINTDTCQMSSPISMLYGQSTKERCDPDIFGARSTVPQRTPMWNEFESALRTGKKPGENTLKRELWARFEAVSIDGMRFDVSIFQESKRNGFLDRLEEVSCEEISSESKGLIS